MIGMRLHFSSLRAISKGSVSECVFCCCCFYFKEIFCWHFSNVQNVKSPTHLFCFFVVVVIFSGKIQFYSFKFGIFAKLFKAPTSFQLDHDGRAHGNLKSPCAKNARAFVFRHDGRRHALRWRRPFVLLQKNTHFQAFSHSLAQRYSPLPPSSSKVLNYVTTIKFSKYSYIMN